LKAIANAVDIDDPEAVKGYIATLQCSEGYKGNLVNSYDHHVKFHGLSWSKPYYERVDRITQDSERARHKRTSNQHSTRCS